MAIRSRRSAPTSTARSSSTLGSAGVPETFVVDGRGIIRHQHIGAITDGDMPAISPPIGGGAMKARRCSPWRLLAAAPAFADSLLPPARYANIQLPDPRQERQAKALMETIRCLVCQGQSIADSNAEMAGDMRSLDPRADPGRRKPELDPRLADLALRRLGELRCRRSSR